MVGFTYPCYMMRKDVRDEWRWTYYAENGEAVAVSNEAYKNIADCRQSIYLLKNSQNADVFHEDDTFK